MSHWQDYVNENEIRKALSILKPDNELFEIRIIKQGRRQPICGYFKDADTLLKAFEKVDLRNTNVYFTVNRLKEECYSRLQHDCFLTDGNYSSDPDITDYEYLFVDIDPDRPSGISSSAEELEAAKQTAAKVQAYLKTRGFSDPIIGMSGNGYHLQYRINIPNNQESRDLIERCLKVLASAFNDGIVKIDTGNFNPSRVCKLYGSLAQKGANTADRPYRFSYMIQTSDQITDLKTLQKLAAEFEDPGKKYRYKPQEKFELLTWMDKKGIRVWKEIRNDNRIIYLLDECPFNHSHQKGDAKIFLYSDGTIGFRCWHNSCRDKHWKDLRKLLDGDNYHDGSHQEQDDHHIEDGYQQRKANKQTEAEEREVNEDQMDLDRFHLKNDKGKATGAYDFEIHRYLKEEHHIFILGGIPYIYGDGAYRPDLSGARLKTMIRKLIYPQFVRSTTIKRIYDLFIADAELQRSFEDLNQYPAEWICFHNGFFDPISKQIVPHDPKYLAINQTPYDFDPEAEPEGEKIRKWLDFITEDPEDREMLLQYAGYCLTRDTRQQKFLILRGEGGSGKSTVINLIEQMIGPENISNISLSQLTQRFAPFNLLGKLLNSCADLEVTALEDVSTIKKILGEDSMSGEAKGKDLISFRSYAKLIFSTNELPIVKAERTSGFYRRLLILRMDKLPEARAPDFFRQLTAEIDYFIHECVKAVCRMYEAGTIVESNGSMEEVQRLRCDSDTVEAFLNDQIVFDNEGFILRKKLFEAYSVYCHDMERQALTKNNFFKAMRTRGFSERKVNAGLQRGMPAFSGISFSESSAETSADGFMSTEGIKNPFDQID